MTDIIYGSLLASFCFICIVIVCGIFGKIAGYLSPYK